MEQAEVDTHQFCYMAKRSDILGKARPSIADTGTKKLVADPAVETHSSGYFFNVGARRFAQVGNRIDERNLRSQESIRSVFDDFGGLR